MLTQEQHIEAGYPIPRERWRPQATTGQLAAFSIGTGPEQVRVASRDGTATALTLTDPPREPGEPSRLDRSDIDSWHDRTDGCLAIELAANACRASRSLANPETRKPVTSSYPTVGRGVPYGSATTPTRYVRNHRPDA